MAEDHPFTIDIERSIDTVPRYRWNVLEDGVVRERGAASHATKRDALLAAEKVLRKLVTRWQIGK